MKIIFKKLGTEEYVKYYSNVNGKISIEYGSISEAKHFNDDASYDICQIFDNTSKDILEIIFVVGGN